MGLIKSGNYNGDGKYRQWRVGDFIDDPLFNSKKTEVKWSANLKKGTIRNEPGYQRLLSTLVIHVKGKIKITFPHESREETLKKEGDFVFFAPGVCHSWEIMDENTTVVTIRYLSGSDKQQGSFCKKHQSN